MAATLLDLSRRGDTAAPLVELAAAVDGPLASWIAAANAQNPDQRLTLATNSQQAEGYLGWTIRARLAAQAQSHGLPVELMSQWVISLESSVVTTHVGSASGHDPTGGLNTHGLLSGGRGTTTSLVSQNRPYPLAAVIASSLTPGQEFFAFAFSQHTFSNRQAVALLIAKDVISGLWHLGHTDMAGTVAAAAWSTSTAKVVLADGFRLETFVTASTLLSRPAQWSPITPTIIHQTPLPPLQWLDPVALPADLAIYTRTAGHLAAMKGADGSLWLMLGPSRLMVRVIDPAN
jgi:hypothetical protein